MKVKEIKAKSIIVKSNLPEADFVINPYIGCQHGCKYCYARFMKRFTGHTDSKFIFTTETARNKQYGNTHYHTICLTQQSFCCGLLLRRRK